MRFFLPTILLFLACSKNPTKPESFSFSGTVHLEGQQDHSGVTVALYNLVELDTAVVRLQKEFSFVGVPISQQTEFDNRLAEAVYMAKTKTYGSFHFSLHSRFVSRLTFHISHSKEVQKYGA
jgi:hypothetical protein